MPITKINNKSLDAGSVDLASNVVTGLLPDASVSYQPSGTGAVTTTVQAKLRESVSVKDFGTVGDGVTDDTAAIQAALDSGNDVFIPTGTFLHSGLVISNIGQTVYGFGNNHILKLKNGANKSSINVSANYVTIKDISINGNATGQTNNTEENASGIFTMGVSNLSVLNCNIEYPKRNGIASSAKNEFCIYRNNRIYAPGFIGIYNVSSAYPTLHSVIEGNTIHSPGQDGIGTTGFQHSTISNNTIYNPTVAGIAMEARCDNSTVTGNTVRGTGVGSNANGIQVNDSVGVSVSSNSVYGTSVGVSVAGGPTSKMVSVTANTINDCRVGVQVDASASQTASSLNCYKYGVTVIGNAIGGSREMAILLNAISGVSVVGNQIINFATSVSPESVSRTRAAIALRTYSCYNTVSDNYIYDNSGSLLKIGILELYDGSDAALANVFSNNNIQGIINDYGLSFSGQYASSVTRPIKTNTSPTTGTWATGHVIYMAYPSAGGFIGWVSTDPRGGTFGSASTTGSISSGSSTLVVASTDGFHEGMTIQVAGAINGSVIARINHPLKTIYLIDNAGSTVSNASVSLKPPVFKTFGTISA